MTHPPTALERAFALARSGDCAGVKEVRRRLKAEGYSDAQIWGPSLTRQLREICAAAVLAADADAGETAPTP